MWYLFFYHRVIYFLKSNLRIIIWSVYMYVSHSDATHIPDNFYSQAFHDINKYNLYVCIEMDYTLQQLQRLRTIRRYLLELKQMIFQTHPGQGYPGHPGHLGNSNPIAPTPPLNVGAMECELFKSYIRKMTNSPITIDNDFFGNKFHENLCKLLNDIAKVCAASQEHSKYIDNLCSSIEK
jgi:hypothetical protein